VVVVAEEGVVLSVEPVVVADELVVLVDEPVVLVIASCPRTICDSAQKRSAAITQNVR
jgi:hypothetical protein